MSARHPQVRVHARRADGKGSNPTINNPLTPIQTAPAPQLRAHPRRGRSRPFEARRPLRALRTVARTRGASPTRRGRLARLVPGAMRALLLAAILACTCTTAPAAVRPARARARGGGDEVRALPRLRGALLERNYAGMLAVGDQSHGPRELFYWLQAPRNAPSALQPRAPLVLWLNGGPGSSSLTGLLAENGGYALGDDGALAPNAHAWNAHAWTLFVDQPVGTGFAHVDASCDSDLSADGGGGDCYATTLEQTAADLSEVLEALIGDIHAGDLAGAPLWVTGESFAGRYLPWLAEALVLDSAAAKRYPAASAAFAGLVVGNPESDTLLQYPPTADMLRGMGYIGDADVERLKGVAFANCSSLVRAGTTARAAATAACEAWCDELVAVAGGAFRYDARVWGNPLQRLDKTLGAYLNDNATKAALNVPSAYEWKSGDGETVPNRVSAALYGEIERPGALPRLGRLLDKGFPVVVYAGNMDGSPFNHMSTERALDAGVRFAREAEFRTATRTLWRGRHGLGAQEGPVYGFARQGGGLSFVVVNNAGHLAPRDQPEAALDLIERIVLGKQSFAPES